jgi:hypothetical protein
LGLIVFFDTALQILRHLLKGEVIGLGDILKRAKSLEQATDAGGVAVTKDRKGQRPFLQNIFNG